MTDTCGPGAPATPLPPSLRSWFVEHGPFVCRSLRYLRVREADLDDALQEVFLVVHQRLADYQEKGTLRAWLFSICTRVAHAQRRKLGRRRENALAARSEPVAGATQHTQLEDREALALGYRLLERLPPLQRQVFVLYEVEDMTMAEVAQALDCPLQTAYSRLHKARERVLAEVERIARAPRAPKEQP